MKLSFFNILLLSYKVLDKQRRIKAILVFFSTLISGLIEVLGLAVILPVIYLLNDNSPIHTNKFLSLVYTELNFVDDRSFMLFVLFMLFIVFMCKNALSLFFVYYQSNFVKEVSVWLTEREYKKFLNKNYLYFQNTNSNLIVRDVVRIPADFANNTLLSLISLFTELFVIVFVLIGIAIINLKVLLLLAVTLAPVAYITNKLLKSRTKNLGAEKNKIQPITFKFVFDSIYSYVDLKLLGKESFFRKKSINLLEKFYRLGLKINVYNNVPNKVMETIAIFGILILFIYNYYISQASDNITVILVIFATAAYRVLPSLNRMLTHSIKIYSNQYVFDTLDEMANEEITSDENNHNIEFNSRIKFDNVSFAYGDKSCLALNNINLEIIKGKNIGFIGKSGSGKSTLNKVLLGFLPPDTGKIYVDEVEISSKNVKGWMKLLGYVQQDFFLLDAPLIENIAFGELPEEINYKKVDDILSFLHLGELVRGMDNGVNTTIGEFGSKLSGGQKQRIAIARCLYKDAQVLVFDEATSALDSETEKEIMKTLYDLNKFGLTTIIIAHRISTLSNCDIIYEMDNGEIVKEYTFSELKQNKI